MTEKNDPIITCPKCQEPMRKLEVDDMVVDRCEKCFGIWLDAGERPKLRASKKSTDAVDIGPVKSDQDAIQEIDCPRCGVRMKHRNHPDQRHIGFEECPECRGSYFDAGELRDLSRLSISDIVGIFTRRS